MGDRHSSEIARARLTALRQHPPVWWDESAVADYNDILASLQAAEPDKDFSVFRVPPGELAPRVISWTRGTRRSPGRKNYSSKLYCDDGRMVRRLEAVRGYLTAIDTSAPGPAIPETSLFPEPTPPSRAKRAASAFGRFAWTQVQSIAPAMVNAWLKRKGWE